MFLSDQKVNTRIKHYTEQINTLCVTLKQQHISAVNTNIIRDSSRIMSWPEVLLPSMLSYNFAGIAPEGYAELTSGFNVKVSLLTEILSHLHT